MSTIQWSI